jgi:hypothetical protein
MRVVDDWLFIMGTVDYLRWRNMEILAGDIRNEGINKCQQ